MIKVARFIPFFSGQQGGPAMHIRELTKYLKPYPIKTLIYAASEIDYAAKSRTHLYQKVNPNFIIKRFNSYFRFRDYRISHGLFRTLLKDSKNIDIFHSHAPRSYQEDIAAIISIIKRKKLIISSHGIITLSLSYFQHLYERLKDLSIGSIEKKLLNINYIVATKLEAKMMKYHRISEENVHVIPHGIDINHFKLSNPDSFITKYRLENKKIILFVGRLSSEKRIDILLDAFLLVKDEFPDSVLAIAGGDFGFRANIKKFIGKHNLKDRVLLLGHISYSELPKVYSMADVIVSPARSETFGNFVLEANACEKPVIASNHWGPRELIIDKKTGFLIEFGDIVAMKDRIIKVLEDKDLEIKMGRSARKHIENNYSWEINAKTHYDLYRKILEGKD